jgi:hypothetical protein
MTLLKAVTGKVSSLEYTVNAVNLPAGAVERRSSAVNARSSIVLRPVSAPDLCNGAVVAHGGAKIQLMDAVVVTKSATEPEEADADRPVNTFDLIDSRLLGRVAARSSRTTR